MAHAHSIDLTKEDTEYLQAIIRQRTNQTRTVDRARMLLYKKRLIKCGYCATAEC